MTHYDAGRRLEYKVRNDLRDNGYDTVLRTAGSRGAADLLAFKPRQLLLVQVKNIRDPGPDERKALIALARLCPDVFVPIVATRGLRGRVVYRQLTGTAPGDWQPWVMDEVA